jgi:hypothetical protein
MEELSEQSPTDPSPVMPASGVGVVHHARPGQQVHGPFPRASEDELGVKVLRRRTAKPAGGLTPAASPLEARGCRPRDEQEHAVPRPRCAVGPGGSTHRCTFRG